MDALKLQDKIYSGYAKAAKRLGLVYTQFRPAGTGNPLATAAGTLNAAFNAEDMTYKRPDRYGDSVWYGLFDGRLTQPGDYLVNGTTIYFIASQQLHLPIQCVQCNRRIRLTRMPESSAVGAGGYRGNCAAEAVDVLGAEGWPASVLLKGRMENTGSNLPGATKNVGWQVLLPPSIPIIINASDTLIDDLGRRYAVQGAEQTDMGWRLTTVEEHL
ncbi:hypothetical protein [Herbaspirillum sp. YR522]|uniref:hypothetical protein n=1 Tax=Herbaspirillum sp. YR522 TaxID=1144342 RepID=UPI00026FB34B|nr:hypothetical protein [Herbaspirillum sp. YR522]EJN07792.1 hypothetical protein PMI40_01688 [Herbaspirillum sp. YR522]